MKRLLLFILCVGIIGATGCTKNLEDSLDDTRDDLTQTQESLNDTNNRLRNVENVLNNTIRDFLTRFIMLEEGHNNQQNEIESIVDDIRAVIVANDEQGTVLEKLERLTRFNVEFYANFSDIQEGFNPPEGVESFNLTVQGSQDIRKSVSLSSEVIDYTDVITGLTVGDSVRIEMPEVASANVNVGLVSTVVIGGVPLSGSLNLAHSPVSGNAVVSYIVEGFNFLD